MNYISKKPEDIEFINVVFTDDPEDAQGVDCEVLDVIEIDGKDYALLLPEGEEDVYIYRFSIDEEGEPVLDSVEDDKEFERVSRIFEEWAENNDAYYDDEESCEHTHSDECDCGCNDK